MSAIFIVPAAGNRARGRFVDTGPRRLAQLVEHHLHTVGVNGSSPLAPTKCNSLTPLRLANRAAFVFGGRTLQVFEEVLDESGLGPKRSDSRMLFGATIQLLRAAKVGKTPGTSLPMVIGSVNSTHRTCHLTYH